MSKYELLKQKLIKEGIVLGVIIAAFGSVFGFTYYYQSSTEQTLSAIEDEKSHIASQLSSSKNEVSDLGESVSLYESIRSENLPTLEGYDNTASRIRAIRPLIEDLKGRMKFATLDVTFEGIAPSDNYDVEKFDVIESNMEIVFSGPSDELVFAFMHELLSRIPGFLEVKN